MLHAQQRVIVRQLKEWAEILTDWETRNRYVVSEESGKELLYAGETGGGLGSALLRGFLKNKRPFSMELRTPGGDVVLALKRPFTWFFSRLEVRDAAGQVLGQIRQRFSILKRRFTIETISGEPLAEIVGPLFRPWTFHLLRNEQKEGKITKKWSGALKEMFTDADNFGVEFGDAWDDRLRSLSLAATFLIDFVYFEDSD